MGGGGWVGGWGRWGGGRGRSQGGCERRIEVFVKIQKKNLGGGVGGGRGVSVRGRDWGGGGQGGCERRIEVLVKIQKKKFGGGLGGSGGQCEGSGWGGGVRVDVNEELKFL